MILQNRQESWIVLFFLSRSSLYPSFVHLLPLVEGNAMQVIYFVSWDTLLALLAGRSVGSQLGPRVSLRLSQALAHQPSGVDYSFEERQIHFRLTNSELPTATLYVLHLHVKVHAHLFSISPLHSYFQRTWAWSPSRALRWWPAALHICSEALDYQRSPEGRANRGR